MFAVRSSTHSAQFPGVSLPDQRRRRVPGAVGARPKGIGCPGRKIIKFAQATPSPPARCAGALSTLTIRSSACHQCRRRRKVGQLIAHIDQPRASRHVLPRGPTISRLKNAMSSLFRQRRHARLVRHGARVVVRLSRDCRPKSCRYAGLASRCGLRPRPSKLVISSSAARRYGLPRCPTVSSVTPSRSREAHDRYVIVGRRGASAA